MKVVLSRQLVFGVVALATLLAAGGTAVQHREQVERQAVPVTTRVADGLVVESVRILSPHDQAALAGELTRPTTPGPHPAVVLVSGAGPQDRDSTIGGHTPFRALAEHLTRRGFVVLRLDDRGVGESAGDGDQATLVVRAADMRGAWTWLREQPGVRRERVGLLGHSEGGTVAAQVASVVDVAFVVALASPGLRGDRLSLQQVQSVLRASGPYPVNIVTRLVEAQRRIVDTVRAGGTRQAVIVAVRAGLETLNELQPPEHREASSALDARATRDGEVVASPWFRALIQSEPRDAWRGVRCPVLALNGTHDTQVEATTNLAAIRAALAEGHNAAVTTHRLEGLNHLFLSAATGLVSEYASLDGSFDGAALALISEWLADRVIR